MMLLLTPAAPPWLPAPELFRVARGWSRSQNRHDEASEEGASRLAETVSVRADGDACITGRARAGAGAAEKRLRGKLSRRVAARLWHQNLQHRTVLARSLHVQKTKSLSRSLSACLQAAQTFVRMHPCPQDSARAHAPRFDSCMCPDTCHASLLGILPPATQGAFGRSGKFFKQAPYLGRSLPCWLYQAKILMSVLFFTRV